LQEHPSIEDYLQPSQVENLEVMTTGPLPPNPAELLSSARFKAVLDQLATLADVVLLDSPPALAVTDATILARLVDGVILVVDAGMTRRQWAASAKEALDKAGVHILGVALNRLRPQGGAYYYYYYRRYYAYGDAEASERRKRAGKKQSPGWRRRLPRASQ
jgi:capsular exopolysaccharide synthesis family protein